MVKIHRTLSYRGVLEGDTRTLPLGEVELCGKQRYGTCESQAGKKKLSFCQLRCLHG